jgi:hypothetical protein
VAGAINSISQIGSTPCAARWSSMNLTITSTGGRTPPFQIMRWPCAGSRSPGAVRGSRVQALHLFGHLAGDTGPLATVDLGLADPVIQGLRLSADLRGNRRNRLPPRTMLALVVQQQPHGAFTHFGGTLVRCLAHDAPSYSRVGASGKPSAVQPTH